MKLATLRNGTRDGQLVVVSRDLEWAIPVPSIAPTLQAALDDWTRVAPLLREVCDHLTEGSANGASAQGARKSSEPPWYTSGSVQKLGGMSALRALRTSSTWLT